MSRDTAYLPSFFLSPSLHAAVFPPRNTEGGREKGKGKLRGGKSSPRINPWEKGRTKRESFVEKQESNCQIKGFARRILNDAPLSKDQASISEDISLLSSCHSPMKYLPEYFDVIMRGLNCACFWKILRENGRKITFILTFLIIRLHLV